ncbi:uncharacterized protein LOC143196116 [Rhynchophorus ferrugineus]|uniref:uncharacterized protein LOC143196116 n=1 Tax=Rhynchophorus ferrugineus TaxID=354439 RepID=UPI003FCC55A4
MTEISRQKRVLITHNKNRWLDLAGTKKAIRTLKIQTGHLRAFFLKKHHHHQHRTADGGDGLTDAPCAFGTRPSLRSPVFIFASCPFTVVSFQDGRKFFSSDANRWKYPRVCGYLLTIRMRD